MSYEKLATQSTTSTGGLHNASNAVDGNVTTCMRTEPMGPNSTYRSVSWKVDLGGEYNIQEVTILFKNYDDNGKQTYSNGIPIMIEAYIQENVVCPHYKYNTY